MKNQIIPILLLLTACLPIDPEQEKIVEGYSPVYGSQATTEIKLLSARPVTSPGKIYTYGSYLLINEVNKGIHIYNNSNPSKPLSVGFIEMIGNTDMAVKENILYADHMGSLVALKVDDFTTLQEMGRLPISNWLLGVPPPSGSHFECIVPENGLVVGWKKKTMTNPECYAF